MIPRKIHYCWFGKSPIPRSVKKYIKTWQKLLPDYELVRWSEANFDIYINAYVKEAYEAKKFAFVSDYVRLHALYTQGGIYLDTDIQMLKPMDEFLHHKSFIGFETNAFVGTGVIGAHAKMDWIGKILDEYNQRHFLQPNGEYDLTPNPETVSNFLKRNFDLKEENVLQQLDHEITVYPFEVFCAKDWKTGAVSISPETVTVHHFSGSWHDASDRYKRKIKELLRLR